MSVQKKVARFQEYILEGASPQAAAAKAGLTREDLDRLFAEQGIDFRGIQRAAASPERQLLSSVASLVRAGMSPRMIAHATGLGTDEVQSYIEIAARRGLITGHEPRLTEGELIDRLYAAGFSIQAIGNLLGRRVETVRKHLRGREKHIATIRDRIAGKAEMRPEYVYAARRAVLARWAVGVIRILLAILALAQDASDPKARKALAERMSAILREALHGRKTTRGSTSGLLQFGPEGQIYAEQLKDFASRAWYLAEAIAGERMPGDIAATLQQLFIEDPNRFGPVLAQSLAAAKSVMGQEIPGLSDAIEEYLAIVEAAPELVTAVASELSGASTPSERAYEEARQAKARSRQAMREVAKETGKLRRAIRALQAGEISEYKRVMDEIRSSRPMGKVRGIKDERAIAKIGRAMHEHDAKSWINALAPHDPSAIERLLELVRAVRRGAEKHGVDLTPELEESFFLRKKRSYPGWMTSSMIRFLEAYATACKKKRRGKRDRCLVTVKELGDAVAMAPAWNPGFAYRLTAWLGSEESRLRKEEEERAVMKRFERAAERQLAKRRK